MAFKVYCSDNAYVLPRIVLVKLWRLGNYYMQAIRGKGEGYIKTNAITRILLIIISVIFITLAISSCSVPSLTKKDYLLNTQWDQTNIYTKF